MGLIKKKIEKCLHFSDFFGCTIGLEKLREAKNEANRAPGRLREQRMSQHEAPRGLQSGTVLIDGRTDLVIFDTRPSPMDQRSL